MSVRTKLNPEQLKFQISKLKFTDVDTLSKDLAKTDWAKGFSPNPLSAYTIKANIIELKLDPATECGRSYIAPVKVPNTLRNDNYLEKYAIKQDIENYVVHYFKINQKTTLPQMIRQFLLDGATSGIPDLTTTFIKTIDKLLEDSFIVMIEHTTTPIYQIKV